ncbi:armadillo-type protein [Phlyctochytrium arcticum]|nr:armadillo-type protein [Phlyctochytrium arcticum]
MAPTQSELLQWAVQHTTENPSEGSISTTQQQQQPISSNSAPNAPQPIDPKWLEVILGKEDAVRMRECVDLITSPDRSIDTKLGAFDELEMLVESLDNANDLQALNLWKPILSVLGGGEEVDDRLKSFAAWVMGTAVQNNPKAQDHFLQAGGLPPLLSLLTQNTTTDPTRSKTLYCLSSAIRQNPTSFSAFDAANGFSTLASVARDANPTMMKRVVFLWTALIEGETEEVSTRSIRAALEYGIPGMAVEVLEGEEDPDTVEKCLNLLVALLRKHADAISTELVQRLREGVLPSIRARFVKGEAEINVDTIKELEGLVSSTS